MKSFEYELIYLDEGSNPSTSTVLSQLSGDHPIDGQPEHVVKLFTHDLYDTEWAKVSQDFMSIYLLSPSTILIVEIIRACLVLTDRGSKYEISEFDKSEQ